MKKRSVGILIFDDVEVLDFAGPFEVFSVSHQIHDTPYFEVKTIAKTKDPVKAINGLSVNPDYSFDDAPAMDLFIIAGGTGARAFIKDVSSMEWVEKAVNQSKLIMSICTGSAILAKLGKLDGKPFCTHHSVYPFVQELAPKSIPQKDQRFVQSDENIYTSAGISAGIDLSFHIIESMHGKQVAKEIAEYMEYKGYE